MPFLRHKQGNIYNSTTKNRLFECLIRKHCPKTGRFQFRGKRVFLKTGRFQFHGKRTFLKTGRFQFHEKKAFLKTGRFQFRGKRAFPKTGRFQFHPFWGGKKRPVFYSKCKNTLIKHRVFDHHNIKFLQKLALIAIEREIIQQKPTYFP